MKRFILLLLALLTVFVTVPVSAAEESGISVLSAEKSPDGYAYTVTFSAPVHLFKTGWVWLREKNGADGNNQVSLASVDYKGNTVEKDGFVYSDVLVLDYPVPAPAFDISAYGISIVEYFLDDTNRGFVSPQVICGLNGEMVRGTYVNGGLDFLFIPTDKRDPQNKYAVHIKTNETPPSLLFISKSGESQARLIFSEAVTLGDTAGITLSGADGDAKAESVKYENGMGSSVSLLLSFDKPIDGKTFSFTGRAFKTTRGTFLEAAKGSFADYTLPAGREISLKPGRMYSFMNCDTGRLLNAGGTTEFRLIPAEENGEWYLKDGNAERYLKLAKGIPSFSDTPFPVSLFLDNDYQRVQIRVNGDSFVVCDDDAGKTDKANLAFRPILDNSIETGWYITEYGDPLPVRVAMVGDSITNGCCPDGPLPKAGCRAKLSEELVKKYGRVVFVGSAVASHGGDGSGGKRSTLNDPFLYREEGHNGWVVEPQNGYAPANNYGISSVRENLQKKYRPDVICMMLGINDIGQLNMGYVSIDKDGIGTAFFGRWEKLVRQMLADLPANGRIVIGSYTPIGAGGSATAWNDVMNGYLRTINVQLQSRVSNIAKEDPRISFTDNFDYVYKVGVKAASSDGIHLSASGYSAMADSYFDALCKVLDGVTDRTLPEDTWTNPFETEPVPIESETLPGTDDPGNGKTPSVSLALPIVCGTAAAVLLTGAVLLLRKKKK